VIIILLNNLLDKDIISKSKSDVGDQRLLSKWRRLKFLPLFFFLSIGYQVHAQMDTQFWTSFTSTDYAYGTAGANDVAMNIKVRISAGPLPAIVKLTFPADPTRNTSFTVPANQTFTYPLVNSNETAQPDNKTQFDFFNPLPGETFPQKNGLLIESSTKVSAYIDYQHGGNDEFFNLKGKSALGKDFFLPFQSKFNPGKELSGNNAYVSFSFVATEDNTEVQIIPTKNLIGRPAGVAYNVTLKKGETYTGFAPQANNYTDPGVQPTGTSVKVLSGGDIAVTIATDLAASKQAAVDLEGDQIVPVSSLGKEYIIFNANVGFEEETDDFYTFVATEDNTSVSISGGPSFVLQKGQSYQHVNNQNIGNSFQNVTSSNPVYLYHTTVINKEITSALVPSSSLGGSKQISVNLSNNAVNGRKPTFRFYVMAPDQAVSSGFNMSLKNGNTVQNFNNGNISFVPVSGKPGFQGGYFTVDMNNLGQFPEGQDLTMTFTNSNLFTLAATAVTNGGSSVYGYFTDFVINNKFEYHTFKETAPDNCNPTHALPAGSSSSRWYNNTTQIAINVNSLELTTDDVRVTYIDASGGNNEEFIKVYRYNGPVLTDKDYCANKGESVVLDGTVDSKVNPVYEWKNGSTIEETGPVFTANTNAEYGTHVLTIQSNFCTITRSVKTESTCNLKVVLTASKLTICAGEDIDLSAVVTGGSNNLSYAWSPALPASKGPHTVSPAITRKYIVTVTDLDLNLTGKDSVNITVTPIPVLTQPEDQSFCNGETTKKVIFSGNNASATNTWSNDKTSIGLGASGSGDIAAFTANNSGTNIETAQIKVKPQIGTCLGTEKTFKLTIYPTPVVSNPGNQVLCNDSLLKAITFTGTGTTYDWTNDLISIGLAATGSGNINSFKLLNNTTGQVKSTINVIPKANGCSGSAVLFTVTVNPTPGVTKPSDQTICHDTLTKAITFSGTIPGTIFNWKNDLPKIGLTASGAGNIAGFKATNTGGTTITANITVSPVASSCPGKDEIFKITINPTPVVNKPSDQILCQDSIVKTVIFTGTGSKYDWSNDNLGIGLSNSGTGNIPAFKSQNASNTSLIAIIEVRPESLGCKGAPQKFNITIHPAPEVIMPADQTICNDSLAIPLVFSGNIATALYNWKNDNTTIGLAASGTGDISDFKALNKSTKTEQAIIKVIPIANNCQGNEKSFTITVNPTPDVVLPVSTSICNDTMHREIQFAGRLSNTTFNWRNDNTNIGLPGSGNGNISGFKAINSGKMPELATITVSPVANSCSGTPLNFTITVNPTPEADPLSDLILCHNDPLTVVNFKGTGEIYAWKNNNDFIGLAREGSGKLLSFTANNTQNIPLNAKIEVWPVALGCKGNSIQFQVRVNPIPKVNKPSDQSVCHGDLTKEVPFTGNVLGTVFNWVSDNNSLGNPSVGGTGNLLPYKSQNTLFVTKTETITITPEADKCIGTPQFFKINVVPVPVAEIIQQDTILCSGEMINLTTKPNTIANVNYDWLYSTDSIHFSSASAKKEFYTDREGIYKISISNGICKSTSKPVKIKVEDVHVEAASDATVIYLGESVNLNANVKSNVPITLLWNDSYKSTYKQIVSEPAQTTTFKVVASAQKCKDSSEIEVRVILPVTIPNAFTPNGDGLNDLWVIEGLNQFPQTKISVFNRWGSEVYKYDRNNPQPWDGKSNSGVDYSTGTYYYIMELNDKRNQVYTGSLTIIR
jgi:gliding motility-associated-like protein